MELYLDKNINDNMTNVSHICEQNFCDDKMSTKITDTQTPIVDLTIKKETQKIPKNVKKSAKKQAICDEIVSESTSINNKTQEMYFCECGKSFRHRQSIWKHRKTCKEIAHIKTIETLSKQIEVLTQKVDNISNTNSNNNNSCNTMNNSNNTINNNQKQFNVIAYVNQNYTEAKPIEMLQYNDVYKILEFDESCGHSLEDMIVFQHSKRLLDQFLGELIVNEFKKKDPLEQKFWSSNIKKLTFLVRQILNKTDIVWLKDSNGVCITKHIIDPILAEIRALMETYKKTCAKTMELPDTSEQTYDRLYVNGYNALKVIYSIDQKILHHKILTFIAPHFQLEGTPQMIEL
jgi:hypothetical protein